MGIRVSRGRSEELTVFPVQPAVSDDDPDDHPFFRGVGLGVGDALPDFSNRTGPFGEGVGEALPIPVVPILPGPFRGVGVGLLTGRPDMFPGPLRGGLDGSPGPMDCGFLPECQ